MWCNDFTVIVHRLSPVKSSQITILAIIIVRYNAIDLHDEYKMLIN